MALSFRVSSAANGGAATVQTITPTLPVGWAADDLVYFCISIGSVYTSPSDPAGWTVSHTTNGDSTGRTILAFRTMQTGDSNPVFSWTTAGKWAWTGIAVQPAAGQQAVHAGLAGPTVLPTSTSNVPPSFPAGAQTGMSVLLTGYRAGANSSTAIASAPPASWTEPTNGDTSTAAGTTAGTRQVSSWHSYRTGQTGTITPASYTTTVTALPNLYHAFAVEQPPVIFLPTAPKIFQRAAVDRACYW